jgi:hypothetical protein
MASLSFKPASVSTRNLTLFPLGLFWDYKPPQNPKYWLSFNLEQAKTYSSDYLAEKSGFMAVA